jgi:hypothetical protein
MGSPQVDHTVTYEEAVRMAGSKKYLHRFLFVGTFAPLRINSLYGSKSVAGYVASTSIKVSRKQALEFMQRAFPQHVRDKIHVRITTADGFIWIGTSP